MKDPTPFTRDLFAPKIVVIPDDKRARAARDAGISGVEKNAGERWIDQALEIFKTYAATRARFLTEDVRTFAEAEGFARPHDARAWGAVATRAVRAGIVVADGFERAKSSNLSPKVLWRSKVHIP